MAKHTSGRRVTSSHSTYIDAVEPVLRAARSIPSIKRIALGVVKLNLPSAPQRIKITRANGALDLQVRGNTSVQALMLYTDSPAHTERLLKEALRRRFQFSEPQNGSGDK